MDSLRRINLRPLCSTRWTTRHESINSLQNYRAVLETLGEVAACDKSDAWTKANGLHACMITLMFYFSLVSLMIFERTQALFKTLQTVTAVMHATKLSHTCIQHLRDDSEWSSLWESCLKKAASLNLDPPGVPHARRPRRRIHEGAPERWRVPYNDLLSVSWQYSKFDQFPTAAEE